MASGDEFPLRFAVSVAEDRAQVVRDLVTYGGLSEAEAWRAVQSALEALCARLQRNPDDWDMLVRTNSSPEAQPVLPHFAVAEPPVELVYDIPEASRAKGAWVLLLRLDRDTRRRLLPGGPG